MRKATAAYNLGRYLDAAKEYEAAYEQTLDANLLFNVAQAYRLAGERDKAITTYRSFLRSAPNSEMRAVAESKLRELEQRPAAASSAAASGPTSAPPPSPTIAPPPLGPSVSAPPAAPPPSTGPAPVPAVAASLAPDSTGGSAPPASLVTVERPPSRRFGAGVIVGAVATGVLAAGAVTTAVLYNNKLHEFNTANDQLAADRFDLRSQTKTLGIANLALVGGTIVAAGVTFVLWRRPPSSDAAGASPAPRAALGATTAPGLATLNFSGCF